MESTAKQVSVKKALELLKSGYVRWEKDAVGNIPGSLQKHFGLSFSECTQLFSHEKLKGVKTKNPNSEPKKRAKTPTMIIVDDIEEATDAPNAEIVQENPVEQD